MSDKGRHHEISFTGDAPPPEIEQVVVQALSDYPGSWRIHLDLHLVGGWWLVRVAADGFARDFLMAPGEQAPQRVLASLRDSLSSSASG